MEAQLSEIISSIAAVTLEQMAFIFSEPDPDPGPGETEFSDATVVSVSFIGPVSGSLCMTIPSETLPELSANMLGVDEADTTPEQHADALKETMNVICGNLLPAMAGDKAIFDINAPEIVETHGGEEPVARARLELEEGYCRLFLYIDDMTHLKNLMDEK